jgi:hypothetical protein
VPQFDEDWDAGDLGCGDLVLRLRFGSKPHRGQVIRVPGAGSRARRRSAGLVPFDRETLLHYDPQAKRYYIRREGLVQADPSLHRKRPKEWLEPGKFCVSLSCANNTDKATVAFVVANAAVASSQNTLVFRASKACVCRKGVCDDIRGEDLLRSRAHGKLCQGGRHNLRVLAVLKTQVG